jgi:hypothetical protein
MALFGFIIEIVFSLIIVFLCGLIYVKTKEIYQLTKEKSLYYFRKGFLFFGLASFFRCFAIIVSFHGDLVLNIWKLVGAFSFMITGFFTLLAIFHIMLSEFRKKIQSENQEKRIVKGAYALATLIPLSLLITRSPTLMLIIIPALVGILIAATYVLGTKNQKQNRSTSIIYILLFIMGMSNLLGMSFEYMLTDVGRIIFRLISVGIFLVIVSKVLKWTN